MKLYTVEFNLYRVYKLMATRIAMAILVSSCQILIISILLIILIFVLRNYFHSVQILESH